MTTSIQDLQAAAEAAQEEDRRRIVAGVLELHCTPPGRGWDLVASNSFGCRLETCRVPKSMCARKAYRVTTVVRCSLETFFSFIESPGNQFLFDPTLESNEVVNMTPTSTTMHTTYHRTALVSSRDFCTEVASHPIDATRLKECTLALPSCYQAPEGAEVRVRGYASGAVNSDAAPATSKVIRGHVVCFGYVGLSWQPSETVVVTIGCVDPCGSLPGFLVESAYTSNCEKLASIRRLCEASEVIMRNKRDHVTTESVSVVVHDAEEGGEAPPVDNVRSLNKEEAASEEPSLAVDHPTTVSVDHSPEAAVAAEEVTRDQHQPAAGLEEDSAVEVVVEEPKTEVPQEEAVVPVTVPEQEAQPSEAPAVSECDEESSGEVEPVENGTLATVSSASPRAMLAMMHPPAVVSAGQMDVLRPLVLLHGRTDWRMGRVLQDCLLEDCSVSFCKVKALRISTEVRCSLETFERFLTDISALRKVDPTLDKIQILNDDGAVKTVYSSYKQIVKLVSARDFCTDTTRVQLSAEDAHGLGIQGVASNVLIHAAITNPTAMAPQSGYVRGFLHTYGHLAFPLAPTAAPGQGQGRPAPKLKLFTVGCADPGGKIPKWVIDAAKEEGCKKMAATRRFLEELELSSPPAPLEPTIISSEARPAAVQKEAPVPPQSREVAPAPVKRPVAVATEEKEAPVVVPSSVKDEAPPIPVLAATPTTTITTTASPVVEEVSSPELEVSSPEPVELSQTQTEVFVQREQQLESFYDEDINAILSPLIALQRSERWEYKTQSGDCRVDTCIPSHVKGRSQWALRVSTELRCSLEEFIAVSSDILSLRKIDASVQQVRLLDSPPYGTVAHVVHRADSKIGPPRDYCTLTAQRTLSQDEGSQAGLHSATIRSAAYVVNSVDSTDLPPQKGFERGVVRCQGYIVVATPPSADRVRLHHLAYLDKRTGADAAWSTKARDGFVAAAAAAVTRVKAHCEGSHGSVAPPIAAPHSPPVVEQRLPAEPSTRRRVSSMRAPLAEAAVAKTLKFHSARNWSAKRRIGRCDVEEMTLPNTELQVARVTMEYLCCMDTFQTGLDNVGSITRYDPAVASVELDADETVNILILRYKPSSKFLPGKALKILLADEELDHAQGSKQGLYTSGIRSCASIKAGVQQGQMIAGTTNIHLYSYVAIATPPEAQRVRVAHLFCIDPSGTGKKIPSKVWENGVKEACSRVTFLGVICQQLEEKRRERLRMQEEAASVASSPSPTCSPDRSPPTQEITPLHREDVAPSGSLLSTAAPPPPPPVVAEEEKIEAAVPTTSIATTRSTADTVAAAPAAERVAVPAPVTSPVAAAPLPEAVVVMPSPSDGSLPLPPEKAASVSSSRPSSTAIELSMLQLTILRPLLLLHNRTDWQMGRVLQGCLLEECSVTYSKVKALRISTEVRCSLETFERFLTDESALRQLDPTLDKLEVVQEDGDVKTVYSSYKQPVRLISARDFCTETTRVLLTQDQAARDQIGMSSTTGPLLISAVINSTAVPPRKGYVRGVIHSYGYIALSGTGPGRSEAGIQLYMIASVEPGGKIPNWLIEAAKADNCKKLAAIRTLLEA